MERHLLKMEALIFNAWQLTASKFIFLCWTGKEVNKMGGTPNTNFVIDIANNGLITEAQFSFGPYQELLIDCLNLGTYSMFRTFKWENGKGVPSPTYYVHNATETIVAEEVWQFSPDYKYEFEGYDADLLCETIYGHRDIQQVQVNLKRVVDPRHIYCFLLEEWAPELCQNLKDEVLLALD